MATVKTMTSIRVAISLVYSAGRKELVVILATSVLTSIAIAGQLLVARNVLDLLADSDTVAASELAPQLAALGVLLLVSSLSQTVGNELRIPLSERVHRRAMDEILDVATEVDLEQYEDAEFHNRLQRARAAAGGQASAVVFGLVTLLSTLVVAAGVVLVLFSVAPILVPLAIVGYVPIAFVNVRNNRARYRLEADQTEIQRRRFYLEYLMVEREQSAELRAYDLAPTLRTWHDQLWKVRMTGLRDLVRHRLARSTVGSVITTGVLIMTLSLTLILAGRGTITIGDAAVAIVGLQQLSGRLQAAGGAVGNIHEGVTFLQDFEAFRATLPVIRDRRPVGVAPSPPTVLTAQGLGYTYPAATVDALRNVSFELRRGQILAIVGANGSGKSTLAKLICGLLPPTTGTVRWDGVDLAGCDPDLVHGQIAVVFQDYARYMMTVRQAIGLGDPARLADDTAIRQAAEQTGLTDKINTLPDGLDTGLGKAFAGSFDLSIGEWQRLAIARALFRDAPVVVLDEPSASLDPRAESELFEMLQSLARDRIVVFISHRLATVRAADIVLVLDQGDVVEMGTHDALVAGRGLYRELFELQAQRYRLDD